MGSINSPENQNTATVIVGPRFDVDVGHQKHGEDDHNTIPAREDDAKREESAKRLA